MKPALLSAHTGRLATSAKLQTWPARVTLVAAPIVLLTMAWAITLPLDSTDLWWHLVLGRIIVENSSPYIDHSIFSWTPAISRNTYNGWIGQVLLYKIDINFGSKGLLMLRYIIFGAIASLGILYARKRLVLHHPLFWTILFISLAIMWGAAEIKTELFSIGFMTLSVWLYFTIRSTECPPRALPYLLPLLLAIWINTHGAFFIIAIFFASVLLGEALNTYFSPDQAISKDVRIHLVSALVLCLPTLLLNPYGYELVADIIKALANKDVAAMQNIMAYKPTSNFNDYPLFMLDYLIAAMALFVFLLWQKLKHRQTDWVVILAFISYTALFVQVGRVTYFLGPVFLFAAIDLLAHPVRSSAWPASASGRSLVTALSLGFLAFCSYRLISPNICAADPIGHRIKRMMDVSSVQLQVEANYLADHIPGVRIANVYGDGGYLMYRFWPERKVMIDPRAFPYREWIDSFFLATENIVGTEEFLRTFTPDIWLARYEKIPLFTWLARSSQWSPAFFGPHAAIFVPSSSPTPHVTPEISPILLESRDIAVMANAIAAALQFPDLTLATRLMDTARENLDSSCRTAIELLEEMDNALAGFRLFYTGHMIDAARTLSKSTSHFFPQRKAIEAYLNAANDAWNDGDFEEARAIIIERIQRVSTVSADDIYNLMLAEWHATHSNLNPSITSPPPWSKLADQLLANSHDLHGSKAFMIDIAKDMKTGAYDGSARLVFGNTLLPADGQSHSLAYPPSHWSTPDKDRSNIGVSLPSKAQGTPQPARDL